MRWFLLVALTVPMGLVVASGCGGDGDGDADSDGDADTDADAEADHVYGYTIVGDEIIFEFDPLLYTTVSSNADGTFSPLSSVTITSVVVAGDFNTWSHTDWPLTTEDGTVYRLRQSVTLFEGQDQWAFKFLLNGQWWVEPPEDAVNRVDTGLGNDSYNFVLDMP